MYLKENHDIDTDNPSIRIYINRIETRITCKMKTE